MISTEFENLVNETYEKCLKYGELCIREKEDEADIILNEINSLDYEDLAKMKALSLIGKRYKNTFYNNDLRPVIDFESEVDAVKKQYTKDNIVGDLLFCNDAVTMSVGLHYI